MTEDETTYRSPANGRAKAKRKVTPHSKSRQRSGVEGTATVTYNRTAAVDGLASSIETGSADGYTQLFRSMW
jgi:hypothetical protein